MIPVTLLVVAKAPVPGLAKTRLAAAVGEQAAADIAAATLLDTLDAVAATPVQARVVALTGDLDQASSSAEIRSRLGAISPWSSSAAPTSPSGWPMRSRTPRRPTAPVPYC